MRLALIGGGAMGEAILAASLQAGVLAVDQVSVAEQVDARRQQLTGLYSVHTTPEPATAASDSDIIVLAVKPQDFLRVAAGLKDSLTPAQTVVSIMAGVTISSLKSGLNLARIVRAMPNTPAQVGEGMTVWTATEEVDSEALAEVRAIFAAMGKEASVPDEHYLDMVTAISGSGPAYVFLFIEALVDAGVNIGLSRELATTMALQTVEGSAKYASQSGRHLAELRNQVTSPGGTTAEAIRALEAQGFRSAISEAVMAAYNRSQALGEGK